MSALDDILTIINANAGWRENGSVAEAKLFATAVRKLLFNAPAYASSGAGIAVNLPIEQYEKQLEAAEAYVAANDTAASASGGGSVIHASARNFRS